jgi:asparagine synthase (glutamine-hydrolysing)
MCGIFGILTREPVEIPREVIDAAAAILHPRGPDQLGIFQTPGCLLGMCRLAIIDPHGSPPPFGNESGHIQMVGNGEIYNYREIRQRLEQYNHHFVSGNDLEVVAHLVEEKQEDWELGLRGMFALAVLDRNRQRLLLTRDRFGIKPLFWTGGKEGIAFASTLPALKAMLLTWGKTATDGTIPRDLLPYTESAGWTLNLEALRLYLDTLCVPAPHTFYAGVHLLEPGHRLIWNRTGTVENQTWWRLSYQPKQRIGISDAVEEFAESFRESIRYHLVSDVPVGVFLSGGLDSSLIALEAAALTNRQITAWTVGFHESEYSELETARETAALLGIPHREILLDPFTPDELPQVLDCMNQPFGDSSLWPTWKISQAVGREFKVVLSGDGGDELWGGYPYYPIWNLSKMLPKSAGPTVQAAHGRFARIRNRMGDLFRTPEKLYQRWHHQDPTGHFWNSFLRPEFQMEPYRFMAPSGKMNGYEKLLSMDVSYYLPYDLLEKVDSASMAHSLEVRVPWLDPVLFEKIAHWPSHLKISGLLTKWPVRRMLARSSPNCLPKKVLKGKKKGFGIPLHAWLRRELAPQFEEGVLGRDSPLCLLFHQDALRRLFEAHRAGCGRWGHSLWVLLVLDIWMRKNSLSL